jgi:uncharacterized short protein YbdD (DUF466 family)
MKTRLLQVWQAVRSIFGDDAYEHYVAHCRRHHPAAIPPDRRRFYQLELERRWNGGPNRCC